MSLIFQNIKNQFKSKLPFVCYCKPNSVKLIALLQHTDDLYELDNDKSGFAFVSFDNQKRYLIPENKSNVIFDTVSNSDFIFENSFTSEFKLEDKINFENLCARY